MKKLIISLVLFIAVTALVNTVFSQQLNFPLDTLIKDSNYNYRSLIKFDTQGYLHLVNSSQFSTQSNTREIFYWTNKSGTFVPTKLTNNAIDDNYAIHDFDRNGKVHIGWERRDAGNNFQLIYSNNRNDSNVFIEPIWITTGGVNKATPFMCAGKKDSLVHFVYYTYVASVVDYAYYRNYNYVTGVLSQEYQMGVAETGSENDIECVVDTNGVVHIVYSTNSAAGSPYALKYYTFSNGVLTERPTGVNSNAEYPSICLDPKTNSVHVIYRHSTERRVYLLTRNSAGVFSTPYAVTASGLGYPSYWRGFDVDETGRVYFTFQNSNATAPKGFFLVHGLPGATFSEPILIWEDAVNYLGKGSSSVTARGNGDIAIAFDPTASRFGTVASDIFIKKGILTTSGIGEEPVTVSDFRLSQNYPNPFNSTTTFEFHVPKQSAVRVSVFDVRGNEVDVIVNKEMQAGVYKYNYNAGKLSSGVYFLSLKAGIFTETRKMMLVE